jgi:FkbM family methyltransferase
MILTDALHKAASILSDSAALRALATWPTFSYSSYFLVRRLKGLGLTPRCVIDAGANVGQFAVAAAKLLNPQRIYSFEPQPACLQILERNLTRCQIPFECHALALGTHTGTANLVLNSHNHSSSLLPLGDDHKRAFPSAKENGSLEVQMSSLDIFFKDVVLPSPVLLKLDVQGFEANVLLGATELLTRCNHVVLETSFRPLYQSESSFNELNLLLQQHKFCFKQPVGFLQNPASGEILQMDALFERSERIT